MSGDIGQDAITRLFRAAVAEIYGDRVERAVLFGSRARGESTKLKTR